MFRRIFVLLSFFLFLNPFRMTAEPAQSKSYLALPSGASDPVPAVILIHEWWGLNDQTRKLADQFAGLGYAAFAVDLYEGKSTADPAEAHELMRGMPEDRAVKTLKDAVTFLKSNPAVNPEKIAVVGWCMGGGYALQLALEEPSLSAVVMFYGRLVTDEARLKTLTPPLLGFFGGLDRGISKDSVQQFQRTLEKYNKKPEITIYEDAGHAFANPENPGYNAKAAADSWEKTQVFLKRQLS
jgi:carboxymethylenebutenolidase